MTIFPRLLHYSKAPLKLADVQSNKQSNFPAFKPQGLWICAGSETGDGWKEWCESENFNTHCFVHTQEVTLAADARILLIDSICGIDNFTKQYGKVASWSRPGEESREFIDWKRLADTHQGIIIAPYFWERRLKQFTTWYYPWDVASGCIWDPSAIESITEIA